MKIPKLKKWLNAFIVLLFLIICGIFVYKLLINTNTKIETMESSTTLKKSPTRVLMTNFGYDFYDVYHNTWNELVLVMPWRKDDSVRCPHITYRGNLLETIKCDHTHVLLFKIEMDYIHTIDLEIDQVLVENIRVNKYPDYENKIILSGIVKNEDKYILQWIDYHSQLGVDQFVFYDNETPDKSKLTKTLENHITSGKVLLLDWSYTHIFQQTHENHSIHAFPTAKYIGFTDVDEYINLQNGTKTIDECLNRVIQENQVDTTAISGFTIYSKLFYNPDGLSTDGTDFLKIANCSELITDSRQKMFIIPRNTQVISVHVVTNGHPTYIVNDKDMIFNHYFYLNKEDRGKERTEFKDDSIQQFILKNIV